MQTLNELIFNENNVAFHPMIGNSYQLNSIAHKIITLMQTGATKDEVVEQIALEYDVAKDVLFIDISDFISKLKVYGLL